MEDDQNSPSNAANDDLDLPPPSDDSGFDSSNLLTAQPGLPVPAEPIPIRDVAIVAVVLLVSMAVFFLLKRSFELWCVGRRVAPDKAKLAGWCLFLGLLMLSLATTLYMLSAEKFGVTIFMAPILGASIVALVFAGLNSRR